MFAEVSFLKTALQENLQNLLSDVYFNRDLNTYDKEHFTDVLNSTLESSNPMTYVISQKEYGCYSKKHMISIYFFASNPIFAMGSMLIFAAIEKFLFRQ